MKVLLLGIESHKQDEVRSLHNKRATLKHAAVALATMRNHGIEAWGCFIINPDWVEQDFDDLATYVNDQKIAFPQFTVLTPLPGTVLTERLVKKGLLHWPDVALPLLDFLHAAIPTRLPLSRFYEKLAELYAQTSMERNSQMVKRAMRNNVINREWLKSTTGREARAGFAKLQQASEYLRAHRGFSSGVDQ